MCCKNSLLFEKLINKVIIIIIIIKKIYIFVVVIVIVVIIIIIIIIIIITIIIIIIIITFPRLYALRALKRSVVPCCDFLGVFVARCSTRH